MGLVDGYSIVDILICNGVSCRTVSGWKHSSTKASLAGVMTLKERYYSPKTLFTLDDRQWHGFFNIRLAKRAFISVISTLLNY